MNKCFIVNSMPDGGVLSFGNALSDDHNELMTNWI